MCVHGHMLYIWWRSCVKHSSTPQWRSQRTAWWFFVCSLCTASSIGLSSADTECSKQHLPQLYLQHTQRESFKNAFYEQRNTDVRGDKASKPNTKLCCILVVILATACWIHRNKCILGQTEILTCRLGFSCFILLFGWLITALFGCFFFIRLT